MMSANGTLYAVVRREEGTVTLPLNAFVHEQSLFSI